MNKMLNCSRCKMEKVEEEFSICKEYPKRGYHHVWCITCNKAYHKAYSREWEKRNKEKRLARQKTKEYREKRAAWRKSSNYYKINKEYWQKWYQQNRVTARKKMDEWRSNNLYKWSGYGRKRRAILKHRQVEHYSFSEVFDKSGGICGICRSLVNTDLRHPDLMSPSVDHILPIAKGGDDILSNVQLAHLGCNARKAANV